MVPHPIGRVASTGTTVARPATIRCTKSTSSPWRTRQSAGGVTRPLPRPKRPPCHHPNRSTRATLVPRVRLVRSNNSSRKSSGHRPWPWSCLPAAQSDTTNLVTKVTIPNCSTWTSPASRKSTWIR
uniref:(northern house mosquito) hypothetical protein n=1 Tax=Culex pipiens TaxID=7175 RepID=A0A8D8DII2_CULPI